MEKTDEKKINITPPKTIAEIVEDLRSRNELDEEKLQIFQSWRKKCILYSNLIIGIVLIILYLGMYKKDPIFFFTLLLTMPPFIWMCLKRQTPTLEKYCTWEKTLASVISKKKSSAAGRHTKCWDIKYEYTFDEKLYGPFNGTELRYKRAGILDLGDTFFVMVDKNRPEQHIIYTENHNNKFNLRKKPQNVYSMEIL